jgi:uncharacterized protein with HEPN domain
MHADAPALIWDAREAATLVLQFVAGRSFAEYSADVVLRSAVERQMEIAGEALSQLRKLDPTTAARVSALSNAVSLRNILIHGYAAIDDARIWQIVQQDVPRLLANLETLSAECPPP